LSLIFLMLLVVLTCFVFFQLFVIHCRALLASAALVELSPETVTDFCVKDDEASGDDFNRMVTLARMCPDTKGAAGLRFVEIYYRVLTSARRISLASTPRLSNQIHDERRTCTHFAAVVLERRIAGARRLLRESCRPQ